MKNPETPEVTYTQPFAAVIRQDGDHNNLIIKSTAYYLHQLSKFKDGEEVTLVIHNKKPKRSIAQNSYYWGVYLPLIAKETGERNLDRLHELFKGLFLTEGVVKVLGKKVRMKKSTTELSRVEFQEYIMAIENETQVEAPPTKNYGL